MFEKNVYHINLFEDSCIFLHIYDICIYLYETTHVASEKFVRIHPIGHTSGTTESTDFAAVVPQETTLIKKVTNPPGNGKPPLWLEHIGT
jgi:hypothetical protein